MNILQLCLKPPYPQVDGGCIAMAAMTESLLIANHEVKVLCISTQKHPFQEDRVPKEILSTTKMEAVEVDTRIKPASALLNLFSNKSYNIERFESDEFEQLLINTLAGREFDVIQVESLFCAPYLSTIRKYSNAKIVLRAHNIEHQIWYGLANQETNPIKRWYLNLLADRLKRYEVNVIKEFDAILPITKEDKTSFLSFGVKSSLEVIPIGLDTSNVIVKEQPNKSVHLYHLGAMNWAPNVEGVEWFINEVWPAISKEFPQLKCSLAGRKMPSHLLSKKQKNLSIEGEVASVSEFIADKTVAIIPLLSGSGMRVKIIEALAHGKVVITTSLGATGIPYTDGKNMLIADTPEVMLDRLRELVDNPERITQISKNARALAEQEFDLHQLSSKLTYFYGKL